MYGKNDMNNSKQVDGLWGDCLWTIKNGILTINGGTVPGTDFMDELPWSEYADSITAVWCSGDVTVRKGDSVKGLFRGHDKLRVADLNNFDMSGTVSLESMFEGCESLRSVMLKPSCGFGVVSMRAMFRNCKSLISVDLKSFDVSSVEDMTEMFFGCTKLYEADISGWDIRSLRMASGMFAYCIDLEKIEFPQGKAGHIFDIGHMFSGCRNLSTAVFSKIEMPALRNTGKMFKNCISLKYFDSDGLKAEGIQIAEGMFENCSELKTLDLAGFGEAAGKIAVDAGKDCRNLSSVYIGSANDMLLFDEEWDCTENLIYYRRGASFTLRYLSEEGEGETKADVFRAGDNIRVRNCDYVFPGRDVFKDWNTGKDGFGEAYLPGDVIGPFFADTVLFAMCGGEPQIRDFKIPDTIIYGEKLSDFIRLTDENKKNIDSLFIEVSKDGRSDWKRFSSDAIIPVSLSGCYVRFCAVNNLGTGYSKEKKLVVKKADVDVKNIMWKKPEDPVYNGTVKTVEMINVPFGLEVRCKGNRAIDAGIYTVVSEFIYDKNNYNELPAIPDFKWEIEKADYDLSGAGWDYNEYSDFVYDGEEKSVKVKGLPDGVIPVYENNSAVDAGEYTSSVFLYYDDKNYNRPAEIPQCRWEIKKAQFDMSDVKWNGLTEYRYTGESREMLLTGLPKGLIAEYDGNIGLEVGDYTAHASFRVEDEKNYEIPHDMQLDFSIIKGVYDFSEVHWDYTEPFLCDRTEKEVTLVGLPEGVTPIYSGNRAGKYGSYHASAKMRYDVDRYIDPGMLYCDWEIRRKEFDTDSVYWDYSGPFMYSSSEFSVKLCGLPDDVEVNYSGNHAVNAGSYTASAELLLDEEIYIKPNIPDLNWEIEKFKPDVLDIAWDYTSPYVYDGTEKTVTLINVPEFITVTYENNTAMKAGAYRANATFSAVDSANISASGVMSLSWEIMKADIDMSGVCWDEESSFVYDGTEKKTVLINVPEELDVIYRDNFAEKAGLYVAEALFSLKDDENFNLPEPMKHNWMIEKAEYDMSEVIWTDSEDFIYDGTEKTVTLMNLPEGVTSLYAGNSAVDAGVYTATAMLRYDADNYIAPFVEQCRWSIKRAEIRVSNISWDYEKPFVFDGEIKEIVLRDVPEGVTVRYLSNKASVSGEYQAEAFFTPEQPENYSVAEKIVCRWKIEKKEFDMSEVEWDSSGDFVYTGELFGVHLINVPEGLDVKYTGNKAADAGIYEAVAEFVPEDLHNTIVPERKVFEWKIRKAVLNTDNMFWATSQDMVYDGKVKSATLKNVPDVLRVIYQGNEAIKAGRYEARAGFALKEGSNYFVPEPVTYMWTIEKASFNMTGCTWVHSDDMVYNGKMHKVCLEGVPEDVMCEYDNNCKTDAGEYMASARFSVEDNENYYVPDSMVYTWKIEKAVIELPKIEWDYSGKEFEYDGNEKTVRLMNIPPRITVKYTDNSAVSAGKYVAKAEFVIHDIYNYVIPEPVECEWGISKKVFDMANVTWDTNAVFVYDGTEKTVSLSNVPDGVEAEYSNNCAVNAGNYTASVKFKVDEENCEIPRVGECQWRIFKASINIDDIKWSETRYFTYDGEVKSVKLEGVPEGMKVEYNGNEYSEAGSYTAIAEIIPDSAANYYKPVIQFCKWEIRKANYDISSVKWTEKTEFRYDGTEKRVELTGVPEGLIPHYYGNVRKKVGIYQASVAFEYDTHNYNKPVVDEIRWSIIKANYDLSKVEWVKNGDYVYDGRYKSVTLYGLPEGITPVYSGNREKNAGTYTASVVLQYDTYNYEKPHVDPLVWEIYKARINSIGVEWNYIEPFLYDGKEKSVELMGVFAGEGMINRLMNKEKPVNVLSLPRGTTVKYENERAVNAGEYSARAYIIPPDEENYEVPPYLECLWTIKKAELDLSEMRWNYSTSFQYDGEKKSVEIINIPDEVEKVIYHGNTGIDTGVYTARAEFILKEDSNYMKPDDMILTWQISRKALDFSSVRWNYTEPFKYDGEEKTVELTGLPEEVNVEYVNNSRTEKGAFVAAATIVYDSEKYIVPDVEALKWYIL